MSQTYIAAIASLLVVVLPMFGVRVGTDEITSIMQSIVVLVSSVWVIVRRYQAGGVTPLGAYKSIYSDN